MPGSPELWVNPWLQTCFIFRTHKHDDDLGIVYGIGFTTLVAKESTRRAHTHNLHHSKMTCGSIKIPRCRFGNIFNIFSGCFLIFCLLLNLQNLDPLEVRMNPSAYMHHWHVGHVMPYSHKPAIWLLTFATCYSLRKWTYSWLIPSSSVFFV
jgi:hypothetical protein